jgi:hypothetical protein
MGIERSISNTQRLTSDGLKCVKGITFECLCLPFNIFRSVQVCDDSYVLIPQRSGFSGRLVRYNECFIQLHCMDVIQQASRWSVWLYGAPSPIVSTTCWVFRQRPKNRSRAGLCFRNRPVWENTKLQDPKYPYLDMSQINYFRSKSKGCPRWSVVK